MENDGNQDVVAIYSEEPYSHRNVFGIFSPFSPSALLRVKYFTENLLYPEDIVLSPEDIDGDGRIEIPILKRKNDGIVLKLLDLKGNHKSSISFENPLKEGQFFTNDLFFDDLENDGKKEIILLIESAWSALPRGVLAISPSSGKVLWKYYMGCSPVSIKAVDIERDGKKEIIVSGRGTHNGVFANETDDEHSYIIVLNYEGERVWLKELGGYYTSLFFDISDINDDFEPEIVVSKSCYRTFETEPGEIMIINSKNGEIQKRLSKSGISFSNIYNFDEERKYFVVGDSSGEVSIFDKNLSKIKSVVLEYPSIVRGIGKMGGDNKENYIFVQSGFTNFSILNSNFKRIHKFSFKDFDKIDWVRFYPIKSKDEFAGILNADNLYLIKKKPYNFLTAFVGFFSSSLAIYLFIFALFNYSILNLRRRVQTKSHEITEESIETAQEIAHSMKNPMFTIQLEAEKIAKFAKDKEPENSNISIAVKSILEDVRTLKELIRVFMKILVPKPLNLKNTDLNLLLQKIAGKYSEILKGKVKFTLDLENEPAFMLIDEEQMEEALTNLILNSIEALPDGGQVKVSSTIVYSPILRNKKGIEIEIEDNGVGISKDKISEIFKPYYTTKREGYGIGLTMTKRIIEAHGGKIDVYSKEGVGTRFAIFLPWKGE